MFDPQPTLTDGDIAIRPLTEDDRAALTRAASNPQTWSGHPANDRWKPDVFDKYFDFLINNRAVAVTKAGQVIGASRFYIAPDAPDDISIGFTFLDCAHWGGSVNKALKVLMLDHAFSCFDRVWFHISLTNIRSQNATAKLGAMKHHDAVLDLSGSPAEWQCWVLARP